ncbi:ATP-binding protein [Desulfovibrio inopinatus]|uniref:ATP-binding protein n=1 Tax=Desulfovibrio inopinatus TaxID=102109 RepID=UPI000683DD2F|nr:sensor histidine kinase [Desulfovibrio inopinatus]
MGVGGLFRWVRPQSIQSHLIQLVLLLVAVQTVLGWLAVSDLASNITEEQVGQRALQTAETVALIPKIQTALEAQDPEGEIQILAETIRQVTGASFIVVADSTGRRYSHPNPDRLGEIFVGGDFQPAVTDGRMYVSKSMGTLGPSLRGFAPVKNRDGAIIGFVSVGYLIEAVQNIIPGLFSKPFAYILLMCLVGIIGAVLIAGRLKKITLGLEPADITSLYLERGAVLEAIREGVTAVDSRGTIRLANRAAMRYLGMDEYDDHGDAANRHIDDVIPGIGLKTALRTGVAEYDQERTVKGRDLIFNIVPVLHGETVQGVVASFRRKDELDQLAMELSRVQEYTELLRVQAHEYSNKLHMIAGLIQIEAYGEALDVIVRESSGYEELLQFLTDAVPHPVLAAIILGKFNRSRELKINFLVDRESSMADVPAWIPQTKLVTIIGNLLDNAFDAVLEKPEKKRTVALSFTDLGNDLVFEVEDSGPGVPERMRDAIFEKGVSSKGKDRRGIGLHLTKQILDALHGHISVSESELGGSLFSIAIPKQGSTA